MPASIACTQTQPIREKTFAIEGSRLPRIPNAPRVSAIVGRPVRVPMYPTSTRTTAPTIVPTTMSVVAEAKSIAGMKNVPVSRVVTTKFAASQMSPIRASDRVPRTGPAWSDCVSNFALRRVKSDIAPPGVRCG